MTEQTVVDRVARILDPEVWKVFDTGDRWQRMNCHFRRVASQDKARAAIKEIREPTDAMVKTGVDFSLQVTLCGAYRWPDCIRDKHRLMIDAALAET